MIIDEFWYDIGDSIPEVVDKIFEMSVRSCVAVTRLDNNVTWWSKKAVDLFGLEKRYSKFAKEKSSITIHEDDKETYRKAFINRINGIDHDKPIEYRVKLHEDSYVKFSAKTNYIYDRNGKPAALITMFDKYDVSEDIDVVTGLHSEEVFTRTISQDIKKGKRTVILKIGIDRFCNINVMYGSEYANIVLSHVADCLADMVKDIGEVYRLSGAKFAICFENISKEELSELYSAISSAFLNDIVIMNRRMPLKISAGAVFLDRFMTDVNAVKSRLTYAFDISRNDLVGELVIYNNSIEGKSNDNIEIISVIHQCVLRECEGFFMCYQPIIEAKTGEIKGMEALVRWKMEPYGTVPPGVFIEWLENDPCIFELGNWIIRQAVKDATKVKKLRPDFFVNVNISAAQIQRPEFRKSLLAILDEYNFPYNHFCIELTERCRTLNMDFLKAEVEFFRAQGIKVAMDDFGTGNASLSVALELPVDELKIDMSFVRDIKNKPFNQAIVRSIVTFANTTDLEVCIEGVENEEVKDFLGQFDANWHQGYHYSRPVPYDEIIDILE